MSYSEYEETPILFSKLAGKFAVFFLYLSQITNTRNPFQHPVKHRFHVFLGTCTMTGIKELNAVLKQLVL
jgi:hypothetical protein